MNFMIIVISLNHNRRKIKARVKSSSPMHVILKIIVRSIDMREREVADPQIAFDHVTIS